MRIFLLLLSLTLATSVTAATWIGAGPGVLKDQHKISGSKSGYVLSAEIEDGKYVSSVAFMERVNVERQQVASLQRKFGKRIYFAIGPGISKATNRNTVLNICGSLGVRRGRYSLGWSHCSNFDLKMPNRGIDFILLKRRL